MTALLRCDYEDCAKLIATDETHIALEVENPPPEETEDGIMMLATFGFTASTHFCSMACLATWAMRQHIDGAT